MNAPQPSRRPTAAVVVQSLLWLWLIGLSVIVALGYLAMRDQTDQDRLDSRLQRLEAQATGLAETIEAIQQRPAVATAADLKDTRQILEARAAQVEKSLNGYAAAGVSSMVPAVAMTARNAVVAKAGASGNASHTLSQALSVRVKLSMRHQPRAVSANGRIEVMTMPMIGMIQTKAKMPRMTMGQRGTRPITVHLPYAG